MPLHDYSAANAERLAKKGLDPFRTKFTENGPVFRFKATINSIAFIDLYARMVLEWGNSDRSIAHTLYELVDEDQRAALVDALVSIEDPVDSETFKEATQALFAYYTRGNPTDESSSSSSTPSPTGDSSTDTSSDSQRSKGPVYD